MEAEVKEPTSEQAAEPPELEDVTPEIRKVFGVYGPVLVMAIDTLMKQGYYGWAAFMTLHFDMINDILGAE